MNEVGGRYGSEVMGAKVETGPKPGPAVIGERRAAVNGSLEPSNFMR